MPKAFINKGCRTGAAPKSNRRKDDLTPLGLCRVGSFLMASAESNKKRSRFWIDTVLATLWHAEKMAFMESDEGVLRLEGVANLEREGAEAKAPTQEIMPVAGRQQEQFGDGLEGKEG